MIPLHWGIKAGTSTSPPQAVAGYFFIVFHVALIVVRYEIFRNFDVDADRHVVIFEPSFMYMPWVPTA